MEGMAFFFFLHVLTLSLAVLEIPEDAPNREKVDFQITRAGLLWSSQGRLGFPSVLGFRWCDLTRL